MESKSNLIEYKLDTKLVSTQNVQLAIIAAIIVAGFGFVQSIAYYLGVIIVVNWDPKSSKTDYSSE
jgi:hypothetical protein